MEQADDFVNEFSIDSEKASHLIDLKERHKRDKGIAAGSLVLMYLIGIVLAFTGISNDNIIVMALVVVLFLLFVGTFIAALMLYVEARGYDISNEDLTLHEFAQAVDEYNSDKPNFKEWENHLSNAKLLIMKHDSEVFSKYRRSLVVNYIQRVEDTDRDSVSKSAFESFFNEILMDLHKERTNDFNEVVNDLKPAQSNKSTYFTPYRKSAVNLYNRWRIRSLGTILASIALGMGVYVMYDEQLGYTLTVVLLTAVGIMRGRGD